MTGTGTTKPWFRAKRFGYGGVPTTWEGWATIAGFIALLLFSKLALVRLLQAGPLRHVLGVAIPLCLAAGFIWLVRAKTEGGWHWRRPSGG